MLRWNTFDVAQPSMSDPLADQLQQTLCIRCDTAFFVVLKSVFTRAEQEFPEKEEYMTDKNFHHQWGMWEICSSVASPNDCTSHTGECSHQVSFREQGQVVSKKSKQRFSWAQVCSAQPRKTADQTKPRQKHMKPRREQSGPLSVGESSIFQGFSTPLHQHKTFESYTSWLKIECKRSAPLLKGVWKTAASSTGEEKKPLSASSSPSLHHLWPSDPSPILILWLRHHSVGLGAGAGAPSGFMV